MPEMVWHWSGIGIPELGIDDVATDPARSRLYCVTADSVYQLAAGDLWERLFRLPTEFTRTPTTGEPVEEAAPLDEDLYVDITDLDRLKELGIVEEFVEDLDDVDDDLAFLVEREGYHVLGEDVVSEPAEVPIPGLQTRERLNRLLVGENGQWLAVAGSSGLFISADRGVSWREARLGMSEERRVVTCLAGDADLLAAGTLDGLFLSLDGGADWQHLDVAAAGGGPRLNGVDSIPGTKRILAVMPDVLFTWGEDGSRVLMRTAGRGGDELIDCLAVSDRRLLAATREQVFHSTDGGDSWEALTMFGLPDGIRRVQSFPGAPADIVLCGDQGIFHLAADGSRWRTVNQGLREGAVFNLTFAAGEAWCATGNGPFRTGASPAGAGRVSAGLAPGEYADLLVLQRSAVRHAFMDRDEVAAWFTDSRACQVLPKATFSFRYYDRTNTDLAATSTISIENNEVVIGPDSYTWGRSDRSAYLFTLNLSWFPGKMLHNPDTVRASVEARKLWKSRKKLLDRVTRLFIRRQQLLDDTAGGGTGRSLARQVQTRLELDEVNAQLDSLTGGAGSAPAVGGVGSPDASGTAMGGSDD
ncbi:hypothetical protein JW905_02990 [bacterium]|nr:hypothetical protein [candidate division CSSED10-310 bacterium]